MKNKLAERHDDAELVPAPVRVIGARTWRTARRTNEPAVDHLRTKSGLRAKVTASTPPVVERESDERSSDD